MSSVAFADGTPHHSPPTATIVSVEVSQGQSGGQSGGSATVTRLIPPSFEATLVALRKQTERPNWGEEHEVPIAPTEWEWAKAFVDQFVKVEPSAPLPVLAPCGDGSVHLNWSRPNGRRAVLEHKGDRLFHSSRDEAGKYSSEELATDREAVDRIVRVIHESGSPLP